MWVLGMEKPGLLGEQPLLLTTQLFLWPSDFFNDNTPHYRGTFAEAKPCISINQMTFRVQCLALGHNVGCYIAIRTTVLN